MHCWEISSNEIELGFHRVRKWVRQSGTRASFSNASYGAGTRTPMCVTVHTTPLGFGQFSSYSINSMLR